MTSFTKILQKSLFAVAQDDRDYATQYFNMNSTYAFDGQLFYEPYRYLITNKETFYKHAALEFLSCPEESDGYYVLAAESFRDEENLVLRKDNGNIYYNSYTKQSIWVASNFIELWNKLKLHKDKPYNTDLNKFTHTIRS